MTLGDFFDMLSANPSVVIFYFVALPLTAFLANIFGKGDGAISPWKYLYSALVHLAVIPGIFAITLNVYLFLFERMGIMETNIFTQILPILAMIFTLVLVRKNTCWEDIPGFDRLSALVVIIAAILTFMWVLDRTHIIVLSVIPFYWIGIFFIAFLVLVRFAGKRLFA